MLRWYWWRINAWCEVAAMISSFVVSIGLFVLAKAGYVLPFANSVIYSVALTTIAWMTTAMVSAPTSRDRLIAFYKKVHPAGPGWTTIRKEAGVSAEEAAASTDDLGKATLGWISGCLTIWSALFATGEFLYGRMPQALGLGAVFVVSGAVLIYVVDTLWDTRGARATPV
jgi:hypothetical protein